jgi:hypothetical protein
MGDFFAPSMEAPASGYKELTMADHSRSYENFIHMLEHCRHRCAVAARVELPATLYGAAPDAYGTARAAVVLFAVRQVPRR